MSATSGITAANATVGGDGLALATRGLRKSYGSRRALNGLDLSVPSGVVYGFLGPNGAGKTTTMRVLTGLIHADGGTVEMLGKPFKRGDRRRLFEVGALVDADLLPVPVGPRQPPRTGRLRRSGVFEARGRAA
jgi:ABC-type multidrug transport system, ATPase component